MSQLYEAHNDIVSLLPVKIYRHNLEGNYIYSPLHFHRSIELTVTLTGNIRFNSGSNNFDFKESDWLLINRNHYFVFSALYRKMARKIFVFLQSG